MNPYGQSSNKRDFEMAMGYDGSSGMPPQTPASFMSASGPAGAFFYPGQVPFNGQQMGMQMPMGGFDPHAMPFMQPRFYPTGMGPQMGEAAKEPAKTNADWALEKRRARNRITAAESRRKCKEEIQNLRDELVRLKEEKQEKEDLIEYYRNRYERFEDTGEITGEAAAKEGEKKSEEKPSSQPVAAEQPVVSAKLEPESKTESTDGTFASNDATTLADTESVESGSAPGSSDGDSVQE